MSPLRFTIALAVACFSLHRSEAGTIVVDLDPATIGVQSTLSVTSSSTVDVDIIYDPNSGPASLPFTGFGIDLNWFFTGSAGSSTPTNLVAGEALDVVIPFDNHPADLDGAPQGTLLTNHGLAGIAGSDGNIGGGSVQSLNGTIFPLGPVRLASASFNVTGATGDTMTITPSGIFPAGGTFGSLALPPIVNGAPLQDFPVFAPAGSTISADFVSGTVTFVSATAVPEPSGLLALGIYGCVLVVRRKRHV